MIFQAEEVWRRTQSRRRRQAIVFILKIIILYCRTLKCVDSLCQQ